MFNWDDKDTKLVYRIRVAVILLLFIPFLGPLAYIGYLIYLDLIRPLIFPLGGYFYLIQYSFGLRLVYLIDNIILVTHPVVTPLTVFLVTVSITSSVLYFALGWNLDIIRFLRRFKGYERYGDVKEFVRIFTSRGAEGRIVIIVGQALFALVLLFAISIFLSEVMMASQEVSSTLFILMLITYFLYILDALMIRERIASFIQQKTGSIETQ